MYKRGNRLDYVGLPAAAIEPVPESNVSTVEKRTMEERERWWKMGLKAISDGKLGVLLLSGGQVCLTIQRPLIDDNDQFYFLIFVFYLLFGFRLVIEQTL